MAFRSLFHLPEARAIVKSDDDEYWRAVLKYSAEYDLQSTLDEYVHLLADAEGLHQLSNSEDQEKAVIVLSTRIAEALTLRPSHISLNRYTYCNGKIRKSKFHPMVLRGRFAMRLAPKQGKEKEVNRIERVRTSFNSPFRPFVLATTAIGQEGLDFHYYCHHVVHWNLPNSPVDMEQREGRINRYKNQAIRLNLVQHYSSIAFTETITDPWSVMFRKAQQKSLNTGGMEPFWILDGKTKIDRHILSLPYSREEKTLPWLNRSIAIYRLAFGQPRQDDLLALLDKIKCENSEDDKKLAQLHEFQICLQPYKKSK